MKFTYIDRCSCCGSEVKDILKLGNQPLANNLLNNREDDYETYELTLNMCQKCFHTQLSIAVNPNLLFKNYLYVSGTSKTLDKEFDEVSTLLISKLNLDNPKVIDIASNDGTFLKHFKSKGCLVLGVDPASNLVEIANKNGIETMEMFFGTEESRNAFQNKTYDIVTAFNVFAHIKDPLSFLKQLADIIDKDGIAAIQTSQRDMFFKNEFDTIYHEHHHFYSIKSFNELCKQAGVFLKEVIFRDIHGGSYLFVLSKNPQDDNSNLFIEQEKNLGRYEVSLYENFAKKISFNKTNNMKEIHELQKQGYKMVGFGAAAKAIVLLNYYNLKLDSLIDDNPLKQGKYLPSLETKISSFKDFIVDEGEKTCFIILAWNFQKEISQKIIERFPDAKMVVILPEFTEIK